MNTPKNSKINSSSVENNRKNNNSNSKSKLINLSTSLSDSPLVQDSPVFRYISNLSPIQPVKAAPIAQGFPGLSSPPLVFASPRVTSQSSIIIRRIRSSTSISEFSEENDKCHKNGGEQSASANIDLDLCNPLDVGDHTACVSEKLVHAIDCGPPICPDEFLANSTECADSTPTILSNVGPKSSEGGSLMNKDDVKVKDAATDGGSQLQVTNSSQAKSKISIKLLKSGPHHLVSASSERSGALPKVVAGHMTEPCQTGDSVNEASCVDRGTLRRCLFDENQRKYSTQEATSWIPNDNATRSQEITYDSPSRTSENRQMINISNPMAGIALPPVTPSYPISISKPLGIGLHLNSVVYPKSTDSAIGGQQSHENTARVKEKSQACVTSNHPAPEVVVGSIAENIVESVPGYCEEAQQSSAHSVYTPGRSLDSDYVEHFDNAISLKLDDASLVVPNKRKLDLELAENIKDSNPGSPKKKRKKSNLISDDDTSKRCNCKKTKCLKLYCDCFAAGFYCGESCSCNGCSNIPDYENTVMETRQQIESRNPLAFAPRIVPLTDSPATSSKEIGDLSTPSSARHKRGCNCKKSMCLKKYCECYQANVGCSDGCRCEGCKNVFGKREEHSFTREFMLKKFANETSGGILDEKQNSRLHRSPNLIPVTPALQCSDLRKNALKSRLPFPRFLLSPDSQDDVKSSEYFATPPGSSTCDTMLLDKTECDLYVGCLDLGKGHGRSGEKLLDTSGSKALNLNTLQSQSSTTSGLPPLSSHLRWRSSPISPIEQSAGSEVHRGFDSESKLSHLLDDDTPEILKSSSITSESVKVRSPNKKRVSPPHNHKDSSDPMKSSRKFVLQAVPSFPPLTPHARNNRNQ